MFFDFYTYPILTFGIPLASIIAINYHKDTSYTLKKALKLMGLCMLTWFLGYVLIWAGKILLSTAILGADEFTEVLKSVGFRLSMSYDIYDVSSLWYVALILCLKNFYYVPMIVLLVIWLIAFIFFRKKLSQLLKALVYILIGILPFIWLGIAANATYIHHWFQNRMIGLSFFCLILGLLFCLDFQKIESAVNRIKELLVRRFFRNESKNTKN